MKLTNWKTTVCGVLVFLVGGLAYGGYIPDELAQTVIATLTGGGLFFARDASTPETVAEKTETIAVR